LNHRSPIYCHGVDPDLDPWLDEILDEPMLLDELDLLVLVLPSSCHGEDDDEFRQKQGVTDFEGLPSFIEQESMSESQASQEPAPEMSGATDDHSSTLDHALLESLFYNEMVMLSASSPSSSNMMAQQLHEATSVTARESPSPSLADATTIAEKEMLQDFGVTASPVMLRPQPRKTPLFTAPATAAVHGAPSNSQVPASDQVSSSLQGPYFSHNAASHLEPLHRTAAKPLQPKPSNAFVPTPALSSEPPVSQERAKQLVDQFATLASRLGIELPNQVLQQLTTAAATNGISVSNLSNNGLPGSDQIVGAPKITTLPQNGRPTMPRSDAIDSIRLTAEQAIATVTKKRSPERQDSPTNSSGNANGNKPLYSKRRKKPRLSDCESKLAQLKAENEVLKRHLQNVSNKAHQIEQGKEESAKLIKQLHDRNADTDEMENVVKDMTDTYSDYGVNRQQELSFHLEQLSRLVHTAHKHEQFT